MRNVVNIEGWDRKEEYLFFKTFQDPSVSVTTEVDCTEACRKAKEQNIPVSLYYMHAALVAVHRVAEFRYRDEEEGVVFYDQVGLMTPIQAQDKNYRSVLFRIKKVWMISLPGQNLSLKGRNGAKDAVMGMGGNAPTWY